MSSEPSKRPASKDGRTKSAKARVVPPTPTEAEFNKQQVLKDAHQRAKSAKAIRDMHTGSTKLFPRPPSRGSKERYTSMYSTDFEGKFIPPSGLRPTSPTRRNNPHPTKQFMVWRVPSREIGIPSVGDGGLEGLEGDFSIADSSEFGELGPSIERLKLPPPRPTSTDYGAYLHRLPSRQSQRAEYSFPHEGHGRMRQKAFTSEVLGRTVKDVNAATLDEWLTNATPQEQHTILKMLKSAEEAQAKETINQVMQPAAAKAVKKWLKSVDDNEREVAVRLFSSLGPRHHRSRSEPGMTLQDLPPLKPVPPPPHLEQKPASRQGRRLSAPAVRHQRYPPAIWHHQPVRDPPPQVYHRASLFGTMRGPASHYTVHPEWPEYYQPEPAFSQ